MYSLPKVLVNPNTGEDPSEICDTVQVIVIPTEKPVQNLLISAKGHI